ncbi:MULTISPECIES: response regulator [Spirosoma]|uniref:Response regulator n=1 Tax=Spirosoma liriopis TaxID=2937440 RepID=A0ABT0HLV7_9BACT|nr:MULTISPECIES: response regulator [Spirosoma]MCK8493149.1 response regulator [Spirosoma liriopis]UHG92520.1 response regulator [Spirosoma oryzicola]
MGKIATPIRRKSVQLPILVVEDNIDQWTIIKSALAQCFPEVEPIWLSDADQTLEYLSNTSPNKLPLLILLELCLPDQESGLALLEAIKADAIYRQVPVVILSRSQDQDVVSRSYGLGITSYIVKPTVYQEWLTRFYSFRRYWWESVTLPQRPSKLKQNRS